MKRQSQKKHQLLAASPSDAVLPAGSADTLVTMSSANHNVAEQVRKLRRNQDANGNCQQSLSAPASKTTATKLVVLAFIISYVADFMTMGALLHAVSLGIIIYLWRSQPRANLICRLFSVLIACWNILGIVLFCINLGLILTA